MVSPLAPEPHADTVTPLIVTITEHADVTLRVFEYTEPLAANEDGSDKIKAITDFHVTREVVANSSDYFRALLKTTTFSEAGKSLIELKELPLEPMKVVFCVLHSKDQNWASSDSGKVTMQETLGLETKFLWGIVFCAQRFRLELHTFDEWFDTWYEKNASGTPPQSLLYPCHQFSHAPGFLDATRRFVYSEIRINDKRQREWPDLHLPNRVIQQLRAARGRLKTLIINRLHDDISYVLRKAQCSCRYETFFKYFEALDDTDAWPVEKSCGENSIIVILRRLEKFDDFFHKSNESCKDCGRKDLSLAVKTACGYVLEYFDGLCLTCMDPTQSKIRDEEQDWHQHDNWDEGCGVDHGEPTAYFSLHARPDQPDKLILRSRHRRGEKRTHAEYNKT